MPNSLNAGNKISIANTPSWVKSFPLRTQSNTKAEDTSDGYLFLLKDYQVNLQEKTTFHHYVKKIFTETGVQNGSEVEVSYDPSYEKLIFHDLRIIRDGKALNRLDPGKFKVIQREKSKESFIYDESLSVLMILEDVRAGDVIEYAYSYVGRNPVYGDKYFSSFYLQAYDPIDQLLIRIIAPEQTKLHIRQIKTDQAPTVTHLGRNTVYEWDLVNIPGLAIDADLPTWYEPYPYVWISEYNSWAEVKDWALALYQTPEKA